MRALKLEVVDAVWEAFHHRIPPVVNTHPRDGHKRIDATSGAHVGSGSELAESIVQTSVVSSC